MSQPQPSSVQIITKSEVPGFATAFGIVALILAILGVIVPMVGVLFITPLAIIFGAAAIYTGARGFGITTIILNALNLIISPTFWLNIYAGNTQPGGILNQLLAAFDVTGIVVMLLLVARKRR